MTSPELSVVVPVYNEEEVLPEFSRVLASVLEPLGISYEVVFVNDGSSDGTATCLETLGSKDDRIRVIEFSRNFGHQSAMTAGLQAVRGRACVVMDADLQDPPDLLGPMMDRWRAGIDVVFAVRRSREGETYFKKASAALFYRVLRVLAGIDIPRDTGDFRLMDRRVVEALNALPERNRFLRGLVAWIGFRQEAIYFDRPPRAAGVTKFSFFKMARFALDGLVSFSRAPLRLVTVVGFGTWGVSVGLLSWALWMRLVAHQTVPGWTSLMAVILFLGGAQLVALGVIGEYIARIFDEAKHRPLYVVRRTAGFAQERPPPLDRKGF
jgi:glycosyltransferase involved in cell wall biosynthesis